MVPSNWNEITVKQWRETDLIIKSDKDKIDKQIAIASYFTGKTPEDIEEGDAAFFKEVSNKFEFLFTEIKKAQVNHRIKISGEVYDACLELEKLQVNQTVDFTNLLKDSKNTLSQCLSDVLPCIYLQGVYNPKDHKKHKEIFDGARVSEVVGVVFFYLDLSVNCEKITKNFSHKNRKEIKELIAEMT